MPEGEDRFLFVICMFHTSALDIAISLHSFANADSVAYLQISRILVVNLFLIADLILKLHYLSSGHQKKRERRNRLTSRSSHNRFCICSAASCTWSDYYVRCEQTVVSYSPPLLVSLPSFITVTTTVVTMPALVSIHHRNGNRVRVCKTRFSCLWRRAFLRLQISFTIREEEFFYRFQIKIGEGVGTTELGCDVLRSRWNYHLRLKESELHKGTAKRWGWWITWTRLWSFAINKGKREGDCCVGSLSLSPVGPMKDAWTLLTLPFAFRKDKRSLLCCAAGKEKV